jgi:hypothetical protein
MKCGSGVVILIYMGLYFSDVFNTIAQKLCRRTYTPPHTHTHDIIQCPSLPTYSSRKDHFRRTIKNKAFLEREPRKIVVFLFWKPGTEYPRK